MAPREFASAIPFVTGAIPSFVIVAIPSFVIVAYLIAACAGPQPVGTPPITAGTGAQPREINLIARDWEFVPPIVDLVPGETILLHVVNGGLEVHEAIIGDSAVQEAWERAEAAAVGGPPGQTPTVSVPPELAGLRVVVGSGERADLEWTVPSDTAVVAALIIGCHIPGHWERGMRASVRIPPLPGS